MGGFFKPVQRSIRDMAAFLKKILPPNILVAFHVDPMFHKITDVRSIAKGVSAFREFLCDFYSCIVRKSESFGVQGKEAHPFSDNAGLNDIYPFYVMQRC